MAVELLAVLVAGGTSLFTLAGGALALRSRDHMHLVLGLSGGIDSALVAAIAVDALGAENVIGVSMPSVYSSEHSKDDARELARRTQLRFRTVPIEHFVDTLQVSMKLTGLAAENLQARLRGITLMAISNQEGPLVLATGNKSELAVGYSTIYGDADGSFDERMTSTSLPVGAMPAMAR